jgi:hypothetical protein
MARRPRVTNTNGMKSEVGSGLCFSSIESRLYTLYRTVQYLLEMETSSVGSVEF